MEGNTTTAIAGQANKDVVLKIDEDDGKKQTLTPLLENGTNLVSGEGNNTQASQTEQA